MKFPRVLLYAVSPLFLATACTVESGGTVGLTEDAQGHLVAVVIMCRGYIDGMTLYRDDTSNSDDSANDRGKWEHIGAIKGAGTLDLTAPGDGWTAKVPLAPLRASQEVRLYGWTRSNKWSADGPTFHPSDLTRLDSKHILFAPSSANESKTDHGLVPSDQFRALACP